MYSRFANRSYTLGMSYSIRTHVQAQATQIERKLGMQPLKNDHCRANAVTMLQQQVRSIASTKERWQVAFVSSEKKYEHTIDNKGSILDDSKISAHAASGVSMGCLKHELFKNGSISSVELGVSAGVSGSIARGLGSCKSADGKLSATASVSADASLSAGPVITADGVAFKPEFQAGVHLNGNVENNISETVQVGFHGQVGASLKGLEVDVGCSATEHAKTGICSSSAETASATFHTLNGQLTGLSASYTDATHTFLKDESTTKSLKLGSDEVNFDYSKDSYERGLLQNEHISEQTNIGTGAVTIHLGSSEVSTSALTDAADVLDQVNLPGSSMMSAWRGDMKGAMNSAVAGLASTGFKAVAVKALTVTTVKTTGFFIFSTTTTVVAGPGLLAVGAITAAGCGLGYGIKKLLK